jgi:hypothetical protein
MNKTTKTILNDEQLKNVAGGLIIGKKDPLGLSYPPLHKKSALVNDTKPPVDPHGLF